ncbi:MAG: hypothetical protein LBI79_06090 [Nitrososphaerota archaeon]|jgi:hypothetical protein|nr:hypothetical protein [Nitrososphaerota archaeon]
MIATTVSEQKDTTSDEWAFKVWSDSRDWCCHCSKEKNKLLFDDQTKTSQCTKCGHVETYAEADWNFLQAKRYVATKYMPGKYLFSELSKEVLFQKYLRELNHNDWSSWLIHDYVLAKMRADKAVQVKLLETAKLIVEKMNYDSTPWKTLFEKMDAPNPEIFYQVPQILYEFAQRKLQETTAKEDLNAIMRGYLTTLTSVYSYSRWKGDRVTCWVVSEIIKLCDIESESIEFYTELFGCDPLLEGFQEDLMADKKREININESYIQWQLNLADTYLQQSCALVAVQAAYEALTAKLGIHALWPPTKVLPFDVNTVKKVCKIVNDPELFRHYDLATDLNSIDAVKACYYARNFIKKVKEILPNIAPIEQEISKQSAYIT